MRPRPGELEGPAGGSCRCQAGSAYGVLSQQLDYAFLVLACTVITPTEHSFPHVLGVRENPQRMSVCTYAICRGGWIPQGSGLGMCRLCVYPVARDEMTVVSGASATLIERRRLGVPAGYILVKMICIPVSDYERGSAHRRSAGIPGSWPDCRDPRRMGASETPLSTGVAWLL